MSVLERRLILAALSGLAGSVAAADVWNTATSRAATFTRDVPESPPKQEHTHTREMARRLRQMQRAKAKTEGERK